MRYAIFSDVHANRQAWEAVLADALRQGADTLVCLGDVVGYGPRPQEVLSAVREVTPNFVLGNHDAAACGRLDPSIFNPRARTVIEWTQDQLDEDAIAFLRQVPLQMDGAAIQFVHAEITEPGEFGYVDGVGPAESNLQAMTEPLGFIGHTHLPLAYTMPRRGGQVKQLPPMDFVVERGQRYLVNVGSVGEPRTIDVRASYVIYDDSEKKVIYRKVVFDVEAYKADLARTDLDIRPYFVQVVDAGKVAGAPAPAAAPQLALAQQPKVAEVVAGHHGHLVLGRVGEMRGAGQVSPAPVAQPKSTSGLVIGVVVALVVVVMGALAMVAMKKDDELAVVPAGQGAKDAAGKKKGTREEPSVYRTVVAVAGEEREVPIRDLEVRFFAKAFQNLVELRAADERKEVTRKSKVQEGTISLDHGSEGEPFGLVWEGRLVIPETGEYEFSFGSVSRAALLLYWELQLETGGDGKGAVTKTAKLRLRKGHAPFRVEYIYQNGEQAIALNWSGPGLEGKPSLVGSGPLRPAVGPLVAGLPPADKPAPAPEPPRVARAAAEKLSQNLLAYWSFDKRAGGSGRFTQNPDESVTEKLVAHTGQPVQFLAPKRNIGKGWTSPKFDAKAWKSGPNGVGYEDQPGDFKELLSSKLESEAKKRPHSVYVRIPFEVEDPAAYGGLALYMRYDDGFVAYLNGRLMAASPNAPSPESLRWNSAATKTIDDTQAVTPQLFKVQGSMKYLKKGPNILAIHGLNSAGEPNDTNRGSTSSDMLILPELVALRKDGTLPRSEPKPKQSAHDHLVAKKALKGEVIPVAGKFGDAYQFRQNGSIEIGSKDDYAIADKSFTLSLWFTREAGSTDEQARRLISAGAGGDGKAGWALWIARKGDSLKFAVSDGRSRSTISGKDGSLANGNWRHAAVTVDRENARVQMFIDGALVADEKVDFLREGLIGSNSGLSLGKNSDGRQHHRGKLDDVALWRRVLVPVEIEKLCKSGVGLGEMFEDEAR